MPALTYAQIEGYWIAAGGDPAVAPIAAAITYPESGGDPSAVQQGVPYAVKGWGLWQITPGNSEPQCGVDEALLSPSANACAAVAKWRDAGGFGPWTTYVSGAYRQHLQADVQPATASSGGDQGIGAFGSQVAGAIGTAGRNATDTALGALLALLGALVLGVAVWMLGSMTQAGQAAQGALRTAARVGVAAVIHV